MFAKIAVVALLFKMCSSGYVELNPYHVDGNSAYGSYNKLADHYGVPLYDTPYYTDKYDEGRIYGNGYETNYKQDGHPKYKYSYGVNDPHTGDHKSQHEERDGDVVKGYYTVADPDGTFRTVYYTADDHNGFNAVVQTDGHSIHPEPLLKKVYVEPVGPKVVLEPVYKNAVHEEPIYEKHYHDYEHDLLGYNDKYY